VNLKDPLGRGAFEEDEEETALDIAVTKKVAMQSCLLHYVLIRAILQSAGVKGPLMDWSWIIPVGCGAIGW
jgi:hypothetical protein